ncbi:single Ig IL-1-related receptor [Ctenopharyngodon idella]|uniref:single Ig IL-1-related receptor n=1 Tax=Ctenopharyngodon idella TaxID=7959 RepID=UPI002231555A|nr:single Ig IL-1-related receptor [Ctenopharyngodon idella]
MTNCFTRTFFHERIYQRTAMWRCHLILYLACLAYTQSADPLCSSVPEFKHDQTQSVSGTLGHSMVLHCKASIGLNHTDSDCKDHLKWVKDGTSLTNLTIYPQNIKDWYNDEGYIIKSNDLTLTLRDRADFGVYFCMVRNSTAQFNVKEYKSPSHSGAVVASVVLLVVLALAAVVYSKCRLNFKLWYKNIYGEYELNDGKMYDAYISYVNNENDRKFVNFILKPHLENKYSHKLLLNDTNILPGAEPSAELLMSISHCRRLVVVLSQSYLEQEWCTSNFRQGLWHLMDLSRKPIFIIFQSQQKQISQDISQQLRQHQPRITTITWGAHSMTPSSGFWKELALAMPRKVTFHKESVGDPQTLLQGDKDPMLTQQPDYLDCRLDPDPAGDLGLRLPIYKTLPSKAPVLPADPGVTDEPKPPEIDVSDLGSRNYAARTDFYCLVSEDDI